MARRRLISQEIIYDEDYNALSMEAQILFLRMLAVTDDCGVVPASIYTLTALVNPPEKIRKNLAVIVEEIASAGLGTIFDHGDKIFFAFKVHAFEQHQSFVINKRTRSEYLKVSIEEFLTISGNFPDIPGNSFDVCQASIESRKRKSKRKEGESEGGEQRPPSEPPKPTAKQLAAQAEEIYQLYPLKVAKPDAINAILKAMKKKPVDYLKERTREYTRIRDGDTSYVPNPATWFNQERYDQDPSTWKSKQQTNGNSNSQNHTGSRLDPGQAIR